MSEKQQAPDQIEVGDVSAAVAAAQAAKRSKFKTLKSAWMRTVVLKGAKKDTTSKGNLRVTRRVAPVDATGRKVDGGSAKLEIYPSIANPAIADHKPPNTLFGNYCLARAMDQKFPQYPKKDGDNAYLDPTGSPIDQKRYKDLSDEVDSAVVQASIKWYNKPDLMDNEVFFSFIEHEVGNDGKVYTRVSKTRAEPPPDEPVLTSDFFMEE